MIPCLYEPFKHWAENGSVVILSDLHFDDEDCLLMDSGWITPDEQVDIINQHCQKNDTFICLGDIGSSEYIQKIRSKHKVLIMGNHDVRSKVKDYFDEIYDGPLFVANKILLSHEPISLPFCLNIHGHDHSNSEQYLPNCKHLNVASNVCGYTPVNLGKLIKEGILADIDSIHRQTINRAVEKKETREFIKYAKDNYDCDVEMVKSDGVSFNDLFGGMREATKEERESVDRYIESISKDTGVNFYE